MRWLTSRAISLTLCIATVLAMGDAQAQQKTENEQEKQERTEAQKKKEKKQNKNKARRAEKEFMKQLAEGEPSAAQIAECLKGNASRIGATIDHPSPLGMAVIRALRKMPPERLTREVLPALEKQFVKMVSERVEVVKNASMISLSSANQVVNEGRFLNMVNVLASIGPEAHPVLARGLGHNPALDMFITRKLGGEARAAANGLLDNPTDAEWYWLGYYAAVLAKPGKEAVPILLRKMKEDDKDYGKYIRMVFDTIGQEAVPQVAATLDDPDWFARFSAARTFEMMGPKARAALPALERRFNDAAEDIDVRVAAARAIARIKESEETPLYDQIPDLGRKLQESTQKKSLAWRKTYLKREGSKSADGIQGWPLSAWLVAAMTSGENLDKANEILLEWLTTREEFGSTDANNIWIFMACHSKSTKYPGRLKPETEAAFKKFFFKRLNAQRGRQGTVPNTEFLTSAPKKMNLMSFNDDVPLDEQIRDYLAISVLKDDPAYRDKKLAAGDALQERYNAFHGFFREALRHWALYGIQYQVGSSAYTYKTYPHYFNLIDFAPDPIVRKRAKMFMDVVLVESAQMSISDLRGGSKGRAKRGGMGDRWDPYQAMLYGERGSTFFLTMPADSSYQVPEPALLLRKLGKTTKTYEIINDRSTGGSSKEEGFYKDCKAINYAWCTPEYVTGCGMYDPNGPRSNGAMGRWSGVIFRNLAAISLDAYTGEKWNVQHKDVRITQMCSDGPYVPGDTRIAFEALNGKVSEKRGWVFVDNQEAYAAVKVVDGGYFWMDSLKRLLYTNDIYSPIIIQTGRAAVYGSFDAFQEAILAAPLGYSDGKLEYRGPDSAKVEFFAMTPQVRKEGKPYTLPRIDGKTVDLNPQYAYNSPYMRNKAGSSVVTLLYGKRKWEYDFEKNTVTEVKE